MDSSLAHGIVLRTPWYACQRGQTDRFDPLATRPVIQKYDAPDFVRRLLADPSDSLAWDARDDVWGYPIPIPEPDRGAGRLRFATHSMVRPGPRKLLQAAHERFYAVVVEVFCHQPGLPRPRPDADLEAGFVLRRRNVDINATPAMVRRLARDLTTQLVAAQQKRVVGKLRDHDIDHVLHGQLADDTCILPAGIASAVRTEGWFTGPGGHRRWRDVAQPLPEELDLHEQTYPMWRLPAPEGACEAAGTRSLWFGLVPTYTGETADVLDDPAPPGEPPGVRDDKGAPKLDEYAVYEIVCFARPKPAPGKEHCPPARTMSEPTECFRLAPFFDPDGTKNHHVAFSLPDFRALAARSAEPPGPGGVTITSPPGSQMSFDPFDPKPGSGSAGGNLPQVCTFAIELFFIVAMFLFLMFKPIVVLLLQLWWMLALKFCLPPDLLAMAQLKAHFTAGGTLAGLPDAPLPPPPAQPSAAWKGQLDDLLGGQGVTAHLADPASRFVATDADDLVAALDPETRGQPEPSDSLPPIEDPLCHP
jgi:hypothetical protein